MITTDQLEKLIEQYGEPAFANNRGNLSKLNDIFWAAYYAALQVKIIREVLDREFYNYNPATGIFELKTLERIKPEINALIRNAAQTWPLYFGMSSFRNAKELSGPCTMLPGLIEERDFFKNDDLLVHLANCTLRFTSAGTFEVEGFSPDHRCRYRSPIVYDPAAQCLEFEARILAHLPLEERIILQKYAGQCILGRNLMQRLLILDGVAKASKSSFALIMGGMIGDRGTVELRTKMLEERFEIGRMIGRTLLLAPDVAGNFLNVPSAYRLKTLVGGDRMSAESKGSNRVFDVFGTFNVIISANTRLHLRLDGDQSAWARRLLIIRYEEKYWGQRIFEIEKYLLAREASGIVNWALEGLRMLFEDYTQTGDIILPVSQEKRIEDLLDESDSLRIFVETRIRRDEGKGPDGQPWSLTTDEIVTEYSHDCVFINKWTTPPRAIIEKQLPDLMVRCHGVAKCHDIERGGLRRGWRHVRFDQPAAHSF